MEDAPSQEPAALSPRARQLKDRLLGEFSLSVDDVAGVLEVDRSTVYRYIQDGALAALKIGREYRLSEVDVEGFLQALIERERQRVAELRLKALTAGGAAGLAALPAPRTSSAPPVSPSDPAPAPSLAEPAPAAPGQAGPLCVAAQGGASWEAWRTGHARVHPAHVLLALVADRDAILWDQPFPEVIPMRVGLARQALERSGADLPALRLAAEATLPPPEQKPGEGPRHRDAREVYPRVFGAPARAAMASLGRRWVGTDAILLALYGEAALAQALAACGADEGRVRAELQAMADALATTAAADGPRFGELARHAGQWAAQAAWRRGAQAVEPEDLLLALLADGERALGDGLALRALCAVGAELPVIRSWAEARLGAPSPRPAPGSAGEPGPDAAPLGPSPALRAAVYERAPAAARGLGHPEVGTEHLLLGLYSIQEIADALGAAGAGHGAVRAAIRRLAPAGVPQPTERSPHFGRYSERAQRVIVAAQELARRRGDGRVGGAHLLLALVPEGGDLQGGIAQKALLGLGVDLAALRRRVEAGLPPPNPASPGGAIAFTPSAKAMVMEHARAAARAMGHRYVGTEHLLLGAYDAEAELAGWLEAAGALREDVEAEALRLMEGAGPLRAGDPPPDQAVAAALGAAEGRARALGHAALQPAHLLLGVLDLGDGPARALLERLQVDPARLEAAVLAGLPQGRAAPVPRAAPSASARKVLERAAAVAAAGGARRVGTPHLLLGLHADPSSDVAQLLTAVGAPEDALAVEVARAGA